MYMVVKDDHVHGGERLIMYMVVKDDHVHGGGRLIMYIMVKVWSCTWW